MNWLGRIVRALIGRKENFQDDPEQELSVIFSETSKVDSNARVQPKNDIIRRNVSQNAALAHMSKLDNSPGARARPNNSRTQARVDKLTRIIDHE